MAPYSKEKYHHEGFRYESNGGHVNKTGEKFYYRRCVNHTKKCKARLIVSEDGKITQKNMPHTCTSASGICSADYSKADVNEIMPNCATIPNAVEKNMTKQIPGREIREKMYHRGFRYESNGGYRNRYGESYYYKRCVNHTLKCRARLIVSADGAITTKNMPHTCMTVAGLDDLKDEKSKLEEKAKSDFLSMPDLSEDLLSSIKIDEPSKGSPTMEDEKIPVEKKSKKGRKSIGEKKPTKGENALTEEKVRKKRIGKWDKYARDSSQTGNILIAPKINEPTIPEITNLIVPKVGRPRLNPPPPPKVYPPTVREKKNFVSNLYRLKMEELTAVVTKLKMCCPEALDKREGSEEMEIILDKMDMHTFHDLARIVENFLPSVVVKSSVGYRKKRMRS